MLKTTKAASSAANPQIYSNCTSLHSKSKDSTINHQPILFTFPTVMKQLNQWLLWSMFNGKKLPLSTNYNVTDPTKGFSFGDVVEAYDSKRCNGLGFVVGSNVVCVDIDHCINNGEVSELAEQLADELDTYSELSQSGSGIHLFYIDNDIPEGFTGFHKTIEVYAEKHYIAMTGISISNPEIAVLNGKTAELIQRFNAQQKQSEETKQTEEQNQSGEQKGTEEHTNYVLSNEEILLIAKVLHDTVFQKLYYEGNIEGYASQSEADSALLVRLALLTDSNKEQMRELFTQSALGKRDKWTEREDYQDSQLDNAIKYSKSHYKDSLLLAAIQLNRFIIHPDKLSQEIYSVAVQCKNSVQYFHVWDLFRDTVKKQKANLLITMTEFNQRISLFEHMLKQTKSEKESEKLHNSPQLTLPEPFNKINYIIPEGYIVNQSGIYYLTSEGYKLLCTSVIYVTQILTNSKTGEQKSQLYTYKHGYGWKIIDFVDNTYLTNAQKFSLIYGKQNTSINSATSHQLIKYLDMFIAINYENIKQVKSTHVLGWYNNTFVTPYNNQKYIIDFELNPFASCIELQGTFEEWKQYVTPAFEYSPITRFLLSACFATALLKPLNRRSFNIYLWGKSKSGKSTLFRLGASIWGTSSIVSSFGGTLNGYIIKAIEHNDFPLFIDDKQQARENLNINRLLMTLSNGQSEPKMTKEGTSQPVYYWRTISFLSGEEPLIEDNATNGVHTRTITLFTDTNIFSDSLLQDIWEHILDKQHGSAGKLWVDYLNTANWNEIYNDYQTTYQNLQRKFPYHHEEHLSYVAFVAITEKLICENIFNIPSKSEEMIDEIINSLSTKPQLSNSEKFWEHLVSWIAANKSHFKFPHVDLYSECWGEYKTDCLAITKSALEKEFKCWGNFNVTKVINDLHETGKLVTYTDKSNNLYKTWNIQINGIKNIKCIKIPLNFL